MSERIFIIPAGAVLAGIISAILSALVHGDWLPGTLIVPFLPMVPIFVAGFAYGIVGVSSAALLALLVTPLLVGFDSGLTILAVKIFPAWLFMRELLRARIDLARERLWWAPPGYAFTAVSLYAAAFVVLMYALSPADFSSALAGMHHSLGATIAQMDPESGALLERAGPGVKQAILVFFLVWSSIFMLYGSACLANFIVLSHRHSLRPSLRFAPFTPKGFVLVAMASAALIGLIGDRAGDAAAISGIADVARIVCLLLLLPYFISGLGSIHLALSRWQYPALWQAGFYVLLVFTLWPAFPIALYGIVRQVSRLTSPNPTR